MWTIFELENWFLIRVLIRWGKSQSTQTGRADEFMRLPRVTAAKLQSITSRDSMWTMRTAKKSPTESEKKQCKKVHMMHRRRDIEETNLIQHIIIASLSHRLTWKPTHMGPAHQRNFWNSLKLSLIFRAIQNRKKSSRLFWCHNVSRWTFSFVIAASRLRWWKIELFYTFLCFCWHNENTGVKCREIFYPKIRKKGEREMEREVVYFTVWWFQNQFSQNMLFLSFCDSNWVLYTARIREKNRGGRGKEMERIHEY